MEIIFKILVFSVLESGIEKKMIPDEWLWNFKNYLFSLK